MACVDLESAEVEKCECTRYDCLFPCCSRFAVGGHGKMLGRMLRLIPGLGPALMHQSMLKPRIVLKLRLSLIPMLMLRLCLSESLLGVNGYPSAWANAEANAEDNALANALANA